MRCPEPRCHNGHLTPLPGPGAVCDVMLICQRCHGTGKVDLSEGGVTFEARSDGSMVVSVPLGTSQAVLTSAEVNRLAIFALMTSASNGNLTTGLPGVLEFER